MLRNGAVIKHVYVICLNIGKFIYLNWKMILRRVSTVLNSSKYNILKWVLLTGGLRIVMVRKFIVIGLCKSFVMQK